MEFEKRKAVTLASLASSDTDKSPKGTVDAAILPLLAAINSHPSYFTTSSCSGRISILTKPRPSLAPANKNKARGGTWLFITHEPANPGTVLPLLFPESPPANSDEVVFRFEPLIVAVDCVDVVCAQKLVALAIGCGFRESGITSVSKKRVMVAIRCSIRMEVPLGERDRVLVSEDYVRFLVEVANEKMEANRKRSDGLLIALRENGFSRESFKDGGDGGDDDEVADELERVDGDDHHGLLEAPGCSLSIFKMVIVGEPMEKLFLWGHSACALDHTNGNYVLVFGGFGGMGRHARRNDAFLLDPLSGKLKVIDVENAPPPRLGHTSSLVGNFVYVIGGRADPLNILNDVWVLDVVKKQWRVLECTGSLFSPRHRHAAAVVGSSIYVFGGLNNETISSSLHILNTEKLQWELVLAGGEQPCARHSHSMVAYGSKLFMFGGYNGEKALDDLYSFDVQTCRWRKENTSGRSPHARFSHTMFVYNNFLGVVGGCPIRQHFQELALLDLQLYKWKHVTLDYIGKELLVRSTANIVGDHLILLGGGAACYAFGTKFSEPLKIKLFPLMSLKDQAMPSEIGKKHVPDMIGGGRKNADIQVPQIGVAEIPTQSSELNIDAENYQPQKVLQLGRKHAKSGKDILKKFGWLDPGRKAYSQEDGLHICFPVTGKFCSVFLENQHLYEDVCEGQTNIHISKAFTGEGLLLNQGTCLTALNLLRKYGANLLEDEVVEVRRTVKSPLQTMKEFVASLIKHKGLSTELLEQLPTRWERLGDIVVLPVTSFKDQVWDSIGEDLWPTIARLLNCRRLARQGRIAPTGTRDSTLEILVGEDGWVEHREHGILYSFDATRCMFSWGNLSEKLRMGNLDCEHEIIVDLFAGIGYFVLPFLIRAKAKLVYACEWNPNAIEALKRNLDANSVSDRCIVLEGDNRITAPKGVADRVCLGLLPTSEESWVTAVRALRSDGGMLHVHANVKDSEEDLWTKHVLRAIDEIAKSEGNCWEVSIEHVERVKWYAPHIRHLVADVRCRNILR